MLHPGAKGDAGSQGPKGDTGDPGTFPTGVPSGDTVRGVIGFDGHAVPADEQLRERLIEAGAADEAADVTDLSNWLARRIKASEALAAHLALQRWIDQGAGSGRGRQKTTTGRKTGKKTTGRSSGTSKSTRSASTTSGRRTTRAAGRR